MLNKYPDVNKLTHKLIGCCIQVHNTIGNVFQEVIYQKALAIELGRQVEKIENIHLNQAINYLEVFNIANGLLVNFGGFSLEFKRVDNKKMIDPKHKKSLQS